MRTPATATAVVAAAALLLAAGCSSRTAPAALEGRRLTDGPALFLSASPDGSRVAWLAGCAPAPGAAKGQLACTLLAAPLPGGGAQRVADGVAAMEGAFAWGPDGSLAALGRRDPVAASGDLTLLRPGGEPRVVAPRVTAFAWGPASRIAFSAGGGLFVASSDGLAEPVRGGASVAGLAFAPAPGRALAALVRDASGALGLAVWSDTGGEPAVVARDVASFAFSPPSRASRRAAPGTWSSSPWPRTGSRRRRSWSPPPWGNSAGRLARPAWPGWRASTRASAPARWPRRCRAVPRRSSHRE